jgi:hypothetical protein
MEAKKCSLGEAGIIEIFTISKSERSSEEYFKKNLSLTFKDANFIFKI